MSGQNSRPKQGRAVCARRANAFQFPLSRLQPLVLAMAGLLSLPAYAQLAANALPKAGAVAIGSATIGTAGNAMTVNQASNKAIIDWQSFNIGRDASVRFNQPSASSVVLNRVGADGGRSLIDGSLSANGQVWLLNPGGVMFGPTATINTGGLLASSLAIGNDDFLGGKLHFGKGGSGSIVNQGTLTALEGGYIALLAPEVRNEGVITARLGTVALASGEELRLDFTGDRLIEVVVDKAAVNGLIENKRLVEAEGGLVIMSTDAANRLQSGAINNTGLIKATTLNEHNGVIRLLGGVTTVAGTLDASAPNGGDGGFIETSGHSVQIDPTVHITTHAPLGKTGNWLIDPNDYTIAPTLGDITGAALSTALASTSVSIATATQGSPGGNGDIFVNDAVTWSSGNALTLTAERNIAVNANLTGTGVGTVVNLNTAVGNTISGTGGITATTLNINSYSTNLMGANAVSNLSGNSVETLSFTNTAPTLTITGISTPGGTGPIGALLITNAGTIITTGAISSTSGAIALTATGPSSDIYIQSNISGGVNSATTLTLRADRDIGIGNLTLPTLTLASAGLHPLNIDLNADRDANNDGWAFLASDASHAINVTTNGGFFKMHGGTTDTARTSGGADINPGTTINTGAGNVGVYGQGWTGGGTNHHTGLYVGGSIVTNGGNVVLDGIGGTQTSGANSASGVMIADGVIDTSAGAGRILVTGQAGSVTAAATGRAMGVQIVENSGAGSTVKAGSGGITITGTPGAVPVNGIATGVLISGGSQPNSSTVQTINGGAIQITGTGGTSSLATGGSTMGVQLGNSSGAGTTRGSVLTDTGTITITGTGGATSGLTASPASGTGVGVGVLNGSSVGASGAGSISITGTGATGNTADRWWGIFGSSAAPNPVSFLGGSALSGLQLVANSGSGISMSGATLRAAGNLFLSSAGALSMGSGASVSAPQVEYNADSMSLQGGNTAATGRMILAPFTSGKPIWLGAADSATNLGLDDSELKSITSASVLQVGNASSGTIKVNGSVAPTVSTLSLQSGSDITVANASGFQITANNLALRAAGNVDLGVYHPVNTLAASLAGSGKFFKFHAANTMTVGTVDGISGITTNNGNAAINMFSGNLTVANNINVGSGVVGLESGTDNALFTLNSGARLNSAFSGAVTFDHGSCGTSLAICVRFDRMTIDGSITASSPNQIVVLETGGSGSNNGNNISRLVVLGADDTDGSSASTGTLGLTNAELNRVSANTMLVSNNWGVTPGRNLVVAGAVNVTGSQNLLLMSDGSVALDAPLTVSNNVSILTGASRDLTQTTTAPLTAASFAVKGSSVSLDTATGGNSVGTIAATVTGAFAFNNGTAPLAVGTLPFPTGSVAGISAVGLSMVTSGNLTLNAPVVGTGDVTLSTAGAFVNRVGAATGPAITAGSGKRWLVYSGNPASDTRGTLVADFKQYNCTLIGGCLSAVMPSVGNGFLYAFAPSLLVTPGAQTISYGTSASFTLGYTGFIDGDTALTAGISGTALFNTAGSSSSSANPVAGVHDVSYSSGLASSLGYQFTNNSISVNELTVSPKALSVVSAAAQSKVYDATVTAGIAGAALSGLIGIDSVAVGGSGTFSDKNVGTGKAVTAALTLSGTDAANYTVLQPSGLSANITPASITISGISAQSKTYDATALASLTGSASISALAGDVVTVVGTGAGSFADKNVGPAKAVTVTGYALGGTDAANYTVLQPSGLSADITAKLATYTATVANKVYDGTSTASVSAQSVSGVIAGDTVTPSNSGASFADKAVGVAKPVVIAGIALTGADAANYTVVSPSSLSANITPASITISGISAQSKTYDATALASLTGNASVSALAGDVVTVAGTGVGSFADKNVGTAKAVTVTGYALGGADAANYTVLQPSGLIANITAKTATYTATVANKVYDGTSTASVSAQSASGIIAGDTVTPSNSSASFIDKEVGVAKPVVIKGIALTGADAGNYNVSPSATAQADITAAAVVPAVAAPAAITTAATSVSQQSTATASSTTAQPTVAATVPAGGTGSGGATMNNFPAVVAVTAPKVVTPPTANTVAVAVAVVVEPELPPPPPKLIVDAVKSVPRLAGVLNRTDLQVMNAQIHEARTELFASALAELAKNPTLADVADCIGGGVDLCLAKPLVATVQTGYLPIVKRKIALLIGNNAYQSPIPSLETAVNDVTAIGQQLRDALGYDVKVVHNAGRKQIIDAFNELILNTDKDDSVMVMYAGHGYLQEQTQAGYWIPSDATSANPDKWISNDTIARALANIPAKQVMLVSDSCYSGSLTKEGKITQTVGVQREQTLTRRSVLAFSSGGEEPVSDEGHDDHSIFAWNMIESLKRMQTETAGMQLHASIRDAVAKEFPQVPQYGTVLSAGHAEGGEYLLTPKKVGAQ